MPPKVSQVLLAARQSKYLTLDKVSHDLKIQTKFLKALEAGDFKIFTADVQLLGFLKNYAVYLGLNPNQVLAWFRRDFGDFKSEPLAIRRLKTKNTFLTPQKITALLALGLFGFFAVYLLIAYQNFLRPPFLSIENPTDDGPVKVLQIEVQGQTCSDCSLTINGQSVNVEATGKFAASVALRGGTNQLTVVAVSKAGRETKIVRNIIVAP